MPALHDSQDSDVVNVEIYANLPGDVQRCLKAESVVTLKETGCSPNDDKSVILLHAKHISYVEIPSNMSTAKTPLIS